MNRTQAEKFKELYLSFIKLTAELITFIKNHQFIQCFQISTSEFYKSESKTIISIEEYIAIVSQNSNEKDENIETLELNPDEIQDFQEFESQVHQKEASPMKVNSPIEEKNASPLIKQNKNSLEISLEKQESNQKAKEELAKMVGSNISPTRKKSERETSKIKEKKWVKKPMLIIKNVDKAIEETLKNKYKEEVLKVSLEIKEDFSHSKLDGLGIETIIRRPIHKKEPSNVNERSSKVAKVDFSPDFERKIFETFCDGYSHLFSMKGLEIDLGVKDDSVLNKLYNAKKIFF